MSYLYAATSLKPTAVNYSIVCNFTSPTDLNLVIAKGNNLEIHTLKEDGLTLILETPIYGRIRSLDYYRPPNSAQDVIFVLIERKKLCLLTYDSEKQKIEVRSVANVKDRIGRDSEIGQRGFLDPEGRMIGLMLYDGLLKVIPIDNNGLKDAINLSLEENRIIDIKFLYGSNRPLLCMLFEDNRRTRHVKTFYIDTREKELLTGPWSQNNVDFSASYLIPVPAPLGGVLVIGMTTITYLHGVSGNMQTVEISPTQVCAYGRIDALGTRYLLGDHRGQLMLVGLSVENNRVIGILTDIIGTTSIPETINYLNHGLVYIGSTLGDSQLIQLPNTVGSVDPEDGDAQNSIEVLDQYNNIGPILDMIIVNNEKNGGQQQLVTCSGAYKDGSIRIIRSGIGIHEQASLEIPGIKGIWSLRASEQHEFDKFLVQSFISETRILSMEGEELAEIEIDGFNVHVPTIYCQNMAQDTLVQVTPSAIRLVDAHQFTLLQELPVSRNITVATGNVEQLIVSLSGGDVSYFQLNTHTRKLDLLSTVQLDQDVACMSVRTIPEALTAATTTAAMDVDEHDHSSSQTILALGMWTDNSIRLFTLPSLSEITRLSLGTTDTQSRDILIEIMDNNVYLFIGMGDGILITYTMDFSLLAQGGLPQLINKRTGVLGTHPITFTSFMNNEERCIFACCDRPTVIYMRHKKLLFSVLDIRSSEISGMTSFHAELFPDCLALCSETSLIIGTVEDIQKLHVQTFPLEEAPRRIAYSAENCSYAVCADKTVLHEKGEETTSRVLFIDEMDMHTFYTFELDPLEQAVSLTTCHFDGVSKPYFVVGTAQVVNDEVEPSHGRILLFEILSEESSQQQSQPQQPRKVNLVTERETKGGVYSLVSIHGRLAAGIGSKVQIYKLVVKDDTATMMSTTNNNNNNFSVQPELQNECHHQGNIMSLFLKSYGDYLLVGDLVRSMMVLKYRAAESVLEEIARDYNSNYMRAIEVMDGMDDHYLGCDDSGNVFSLRRQLEATSEEEQSKLEVRGEFHLGDYVNALRRGTLISQPIDNNETASNGNSSSSSTANAASSSSSSSSGAGDILSHHYRSVTGYPTDKFSVMFGTISGAIGSILALTETSHRFFAAVEKAMRNITSPIGGFSHEEWRSFQNEMRCSPQKRIIDGDLVELLLDLSTEKLLVVTKEINDELNSNKGENSSNAMTTEVSSSLIAGLATEKIALTSEDIIQRVEDIARLH